MAAIRYYLNVFVAVIWLMQAAAAEDHGITSTHDHPPSPSIAAATSIAQSSGTSVTQFNATGDGKTNDGPAFTKAWNAVCNGTSKSPLIIPAGKTFLLQPVEFDGPCTSGSTITVEITGKLIAPMKKQWPRPIPGNWISFSNVPNLVINGLPGHEVNGRGIDWWLDMPSRRPTALGFHGCNNLNVNNLISVDPQKNHISLDGCNGATLNNVHLNAPGTSRNTDGIDISKSINVNFNGGNISTGDDCIAINTGSKTINITELHCGPGHGISVGSLGGGSEAADVEGVTVKHCTFKNTQNGARIKTWQNGKGQASNIIFEDITLEQTHNPIFINQHYCDKNSIHPCPTNETSAVALKHVIFRGFKGSTPDGNPINVNCSELVPCQDVTLDNIHMTGPKGMQAKCEAVHGTLHDTFPLGCNMLPPQLSSILTTSTPDDHDADRDEL